MRELELTERLRVMWRRSAETGVPLPSDSQLVGQLGVSKSAIREAMIRLESEGLLSRHVGAGTFANQGALDVATRLDQHGDFSDKLRRSGFEPSVEVLDAGWSTLDVQQAARLGASVGDRAYRTHKRWRADGVVAMVAVDVICVPNPLAEPTDPITTLVDLATSLGAAPAEWVCAWPGAVVCTDDMASLLELAPGEAVLTMEHVGIGRHGERCFWAFEHHRPGLVGYGIILTV